MVIFGASGDLKPGGGRAEEAVSDFREAATFAERGGARAIRWRRIAAEAARQCGRSDVPEVAEPCALGSALAAPPGFARVALDADAGSTLGEARSDGGSGALAVVGPEGGLSVDELRACLAAGCRLASLGPRVLRAETAAVVAAALIQHLRGDIA